MPAPERFQVYMPVPNAPACVAPVSPQEVDEYIAQIGEFINRRNAWFIDASLRQEIERTLLARRA
jgi:hypothetical protein